MTFNDYDTLYLCMFTCCSNTTDNDNDDVEYVRISLDKTKNIIINRSIYMKKSISMCAYGYAICLKFLIASLLNSFALLLILVRAHLLAFFFCYFSFFVPFLFARLHPFAITLRITLDGGFIVFRLHLSQCHIHVPLHVSTVCCDHFGVSR